MYPEIEIKNAPILDLDDSHPAKRFLNAFMECRENCAGRELDLGGQDPVDQAWESAIDGSTWRFSDFVYANLCFTIVLEGFLTNAERLTDAEIATRKRRYRGFSDDGGVHDTARQCKNGEILDLTNQVQQLLNLWEQYLSFREGMVSASKR